MNATASAPGRGTGFFFSSSASNHWFVGILLLCARFYAGYTIARVGFDSLPTWESGFADQVVETGIFGEYATILAFLAKLAEFAGGILLAIGLFTRWSAFFLAVTLGFAAYYFNGAQPFLERDPAAMYSWIFLIFFAVGPGVLSLDALARHAATPKEDGSKGGGALWLMIFLIFAAAVGYPVALEYLNTEEATTESVDDATSGETDSGATTDDAGATDSGDGDASDESAPSPEAGLEGTPSPEASGEGATESPEAEAETTPDDADEAQDDAPAGVDAEAEASDEAGAVGFEASDSGADSVEASGDEAVEVDPETTEDDLLQDE